MDALYAQILTPNGALYKDEVKGVQMPGTMGSFEVKVGHAALVSTLETGRVRIRPVTGDDIDVAVSGGFVEVNNNKLTLLAEAAEMKSDIDTERAEKARDEAKQNLESGTGDRSENESALKRAENRLGVAGL